MEISSERITALTNREQHILDLILHVAYRGDEQPVAESSAVLSSSLVTGITQAFQKEKEAGEKTLTLDELMAAKPEPAETSRFSLFRKLFKK